MAKKGPIPADVAGIYKIEYNDKCYIGQAVCIKNRFKQHKVKLRAGTHDNKYLQNIYNKYKDMSVFKFSIIQKLDSELVKKIPRDDLEIILTPLEQIYFTLLEPEINICKVASSCKGRPRDEKFKDNLSKRLEQPFSVYHLTLGLVEGINLTKYCKSIDGIDQRGMQAVVSGNKVKYKDYFHNEDCCKAWLAKKAKKPQSVYRGVGWVDHAGKWLGRLKYQGKHVFLRYTHNEKEAAEWALIARQVYDVS